MTTLQLYIIASIITTQLAIIYLFYKLGRFTMLRQIEEEDGPVDFNEIRGAVGNIMEKMIGFNPQKTLDKVKSDLDVVIPKMTKDNIDVAVLDKLKELRKQLDNVEQQHPESPGEVKIDAETLKNVIHELSELNKNNETVGKYFKEL